MPCDLGAEGIYYRNNLGELRMPRRRAAVWDDPDWRNDRRDKLKAKWSDPEWRQRKLAAHRRAMSNKVARNLLTRTVLPPDISQVLERLAELIRAANTPSPSTPATGE